MLNYTDDLADGCGEFFGVFDCPALAVEDQVAFVGDVVFAVVVMPNVGVDSEFAKFSCDEGGGHGDDFDREREAADVSYDLAGVGDDDESFGGAGDDFFAKECATAAFDESEAGSDLVSSVDGDVDLGAGAEVDDGDGERCGEVFTGS